MTIQNENETKERISKIRFSDKLKIKDSGRRNSEPIYQQDYQSLKKLPYYHEIDKHFAECLEELLVNIAKTIRSRDFEEGFLFYTKELKTRFLDCCGLRFTKKQHVALIQLYMEVLTMETCPVGILHDVASILQKLLNKPKLLTRDDLIIPWRPLYELLERCCLTKMYQNVLPSSVSEQLRPLFYTVILGSRIYFEENAVEEMLKEFAPFLCPSSTLMSIGLATMSVFVPFCRIKDNKEITKLIDHLLEVYDNWNNAPFWEPSWWSLIGIAAAETLGFYDWTPHFPQLYSRFTKSLNLPVFFKDESSAPFTENLNYNYSFGVSTKWMVSTLGNDENALRYLDNFLKSMESYFHSSNEGDWTSRLSDLLDELIENFFFRLQRERYKEQWWNQTPKRKQLTNSDVETFVKMTSSIILDLYLNSGESLEYLAKMKPNLIVPVVMEKYTSLLGTVTEANKFLVTMNWAKSICLPMLNSREETDGYDGRHLLPAFLQSLLSAIDPNDIDQTAGALQCFDEIFSLVPIVDCSGLAPTVKNAYERDLCSKTEFFDSFVEQFFDKIIALIETYNYVNTREFDCPDETDWTEETEAIENLIRNCVCRLAMQSSTRMCNIAIDKIIPLILKHTFGTNVSGRLVVLMCNAYSFARPNLFLPQVLSPVCCLVKDAIISEVDILSEDDVDEKILYRLRILSNMLLISGSELVKYRKDIESVLEVALEVKSKKVWSYAASLFSYLLGNLVEVYPLDFKCSEADYDDKNYLAVKDWGMPMKVDSHSNGDVEWHIPYQEELTWAKDIYLRKFVQFSSYLKDIQHLPKADEELNKNILKYVTILNFLEKGITLRENFVDDRPIKRKGRPVDLVTYPSKISAFSKMDFFIPGMNENPKKRHFDILSNVLVYLTKFKEDDVEAFSEVLYGLSGLLFHSVGGMFPIWHSKTKRVLDPKKKWRVDSMPKAVYRHLQIYGHNKHPTWTEHHDKVLEKILDLCVHRYYKVRFAAQTYLQSILSENNFSQEILSRYFVQKLQPGIPHHEYKGVIYTLWYFWTETQCFNSWEAIRNLWLALVNSPPSDKQTISQGKKDILNVIALNFIHRPIEIFIKNEQKMNRYIHNVVSEGNLESYHFPKVQPIIEKRNAEDKFHFHKLVEELTGTLSDSNNHWSRRVLCIEMLLTLVKVKGFPLSEKLMESIFQTLIANSTEVRSVGQSLLNSAMLLWKRKYLSVEIDCGNNICLEPGKSIASLLQYKITKENEVSSPREAIMPSNWSGNSKPSLYFHKINEAVFSGTLPQKLQLKMPPDDFDDMSHQNENQKILLGTTKKYFQNSDYVEKLLEFLVLDENGGAFWNLLARNQGPEALDVVLTLITPYVSSKDKDKTRCAMVILCEILGGMKLWSEKSICQVWTKMKPILDECLDNSTEETIDHQMYFIPSAIIRRDPNKFSFLIEYLRGRYIKSLATADLTSVNTYRDMMFYGKIVAATLWRSEELYSNALDIFQTHFCDTPSPYLNIRQTLGSCLALIFEWEGKLPTQLSHVSLKVEPFVQFLLERLQFLGNLVSTTGLEENGEIPNIKNLLLLYKTAAEWIKALCSNLNSSVPLPVYQFLPLIFHLENYEDDPEVVNLSFEALASLAATVVNLSYMDEVLKILKECANSNLWRARFSVLEFLKVFAWNNLSVVTTNANWSEQLMEIVLKLLEDKHVEVRELAATIFSGFLHCHIVADPMHFLSKFKKSAEEILERRKKLKKLNDQLFSRDEEMDKYHSSVLGLCAFVYAYPYTVPDFLPSIIVSLAAHLNDPQPICHSVRKCLLSFRSTHYLDWESHKQRFTEEQLTVLNNIFISSCYYA